MRLLGPQLLFGTSFSASVLRSGLIKAQRGAIKNMLERPVVLTIPRWSVTEGKKATNVFGSFLVVCNETSLQKRFVRELYFLLDLSHRACAAFRAISLRRSGVSLRLRALPPNCPRWTA